MTTHDQSSTKWGRMHLTEQGQRICDDCMAIRLNSPEPIQPKIAQGVRTVYPEDAYRRRIEKFPPNSLDYIY